MQPNWHFVIKEQTIYYLHNYIKWCNFRFQEEKKKIVNLFSFKEDFYDVFLWEFDLLRQ